MTVPVANHPGGEPAYGQRIFVKLIDDIALNDPHRTLLSIPHSANPKDGWQDLSFGVFANAVNRLSHWIADQVGLAQEGTFPTVAYIGPNDVRYLIVLTATIKTGYKAFFISPRNDMKSQLSLFESTDCQWICYAPEYASKVQPWLDARPMKSNAIDAIKDIIHEEQVPLFPYDRPYDKAINEPAMVLHTSGSTGIPKPIICRHGMLTVMDAYHRIPEFSGFPCFLKAFSDRTTKVLCAMPFFHAAGLYLFLGLSVYWGVPIALPIAGTPLTADVIRTFVHKSSSDAVFIPPSVLADMSYEEDDIQALKSLKMVITGSGKAPALFAFVLSEPDPDARLWKYFVLDDETFGTHYEPSGDNAFAQVIRRKEKDPGLQGIFYTFPDLAEYRTNDLYQPHPNLPHHWLHVGRADDIIAFSNGEKLNPVTIEFTVGSHPEVNQAIVVGQGRFRAALFIDPVVVPESDDEAEALINRIWPLIERVNEETVAHGRIAKHMVRLCDPTKPVPYSSKGSLQRGRFLKLYAREIDALYNNTEEYHEAVVLDFTSKESMFDSLKSIFKSLSITVELDPETDLFIAGIDSLGAINLARKLTDGLRYAGIPVEKSKITAQTIYRNPTLAKLTEFVLLRGSKNASESTSGDTEAAAAILKKYSIDTAMEIASTKPLPRNEGQLVILTGSTGSLGSYLLDFLERSPLISHVFCLNRAADGGLEQQLLSNRQRDLTTMFQKTKFLQADLTKPYLGLDNATYRELLGSADCIIHNAWPVNFNLSIESFEPSILGVKNLTSFSAQAHKQVPIVFISSISVATQWPHPESIPESSLHDLSLASLGYGQSKLISELLLAQATEKLGVPASVIRVGQIAGPRGEKGMWNKQEWLPTIIASSVRMGKLPYKLGSLDVVDWVPVEDVAATVLEIAGATYPRSSTSTSRCSYYHITNPTETRWKDLVVSVKEYLKEEGHDLDLVSLKEWVDAVEESLATDVENPAVKLLDTYKSLIDSSDRVSFSTKGTCAVSSTLRNLGPCDSQMMKRWCRQWGL
ncbi:hypothetical protein EIK77_006632 [Talaromyces pinophilus]|nr:hypothetical protein EIK77_006632 [Talaromyces pinophilus]